MIVLNDLHLGVRRSAGTTAETSYQLRRNLQQQYEALLRLATARDGKVAINGDFFDTYSVPMEDVLEAFITTAAWLQQDPLHSIYLIPGNHDLSKNSNEVGSFQLMASLLELQFREQAFYLEGSSWVGGFGGIYAISHVTNQTVFDEALANVPAEAEFLLLHCNFDSPFAEHSDHSLNLSREQAKKIIANGTKIVIAHEHHPRESFGGKLVIVGNQFPSSISDCVTPDGKTHTKRCLNLLPDGEYEQITTWSPDDEHGFKDVDWKALASEDLKGFMGFVRVTGKASPEESAEALRAVSRLRQTSKALVVSNAIRIEQRQDAGDLAASVDDVRGVDIVSMLIETLTPEQQKVVRKVLGGNK